MGEILTKKKINTFGSWAAVEEKMNSGHESKDLDSNSNFATN